MEINFWAKNMELKNWVSKIFVVENFCQKKFGIKNNFGSKKFWVKKNLGEKNFG